MSRISIIVNPHAGNGSTGLKWPLIESLARDRLGPFDTYITQGPGDAVIFAKNAVSKMHELVVCVGGDGTLNEVVNGIMMHEESMQSNLALGFIPNGTGCDFIRSVSIPKDIDQAIDLIAEGEVRCIDLGLLCFQDHDGYDRCRYFHNIASFGLGGEVAQRVNSTTKALGPFISFIWATLISIFLYGKKKISISVDEGSEQEVYAWNVAVSNGQYHGGGMWVAPDASVCDGILNVTVISDMTIPEVFLNLPKLYNGKIYDIDKVIHRAGKKVTATSKSRVLIEMDGEQPGMLPVTVKTAPSAIKIISG